MRLALLGVVVVLLVAGCLAPKTTLPSNVPDAAALAAAIGEPIVQVHEHTNGSLHTGAVNIKMDAWAPLIPKEFGTEGFAGFWLWDHYAFVATDGAHAGFVIVDVADPTHPKVVSQYVTPGGASQEVRVTPDGKWAFMNLQRQPSAMDLVADPSRGDGLGIQVVDVSDKAHPRFESFYPVQALGSHTMFYQEIGGTPYLFYTEQATRQGLPTGEVYTEPVGNAIGIAKFTTDPSGKHVLVPAAEWRLTDSLTAQSPQGCFPHDMWAAENPIA
ncbi:MAG: hypothetical protein ACYDCK_12920, partial [Thermoplasmatota archaeon]